ncbi:MAG: sulfite exporter TauE/SafE family protein [Phycisphaerales bacterium]|nr:sulfite exporter TauE/SafE family protein [Phycisphaerales bacterium]
MTLWMVLGSALWLGILTSISPCPLATNIAAISFLGRSVGNTRRVLLSGLLYTLGRTVVYVGLGAIILLALQAVTDGDDPTVAASGISRFLQKYMGFILGPVLILVGMMLLGMLNFTRSLNLAGPGLQERVARGGAFWSLPLGILFALSFCPVSAGLFFGGLIGLSAQHSSPVLLPTLYGIGTAIPVIVFAFIIAFAGQYVGQAFNALTKVERGFRMVTGVVFIMAGLYYTLTHIYGVNLS